MNERNEKELDQLLDRWKSPEAPPWFKSKVMAQIREETEPVWYKVILDFFCWRRMAVGFACVVLIMIGLRFFVIQDTPTTVVAQPSLSTALDAFAAYSEENEFWEEEPLL